MTFHFLYTFQVLVVLTTDGNDNPLTDAAALRLRQDGVAVFVIGLGKDLDPNVLRNISGDRNQVYVVPSVRGLSTVIRDVITDIGNEGTGNCIITLFQCKSILLTNQDLSLFINYEF